MAKKMITLLTDFGTTDGYVGALKGILYEQFPDLIIIDISHDIEAYNIQQAAFALINYAEHYPKETIHIVVVDPGVGTERKGIIVKTEKHYYIGPDNGVFSYVYQKNKSRVYQIKENLFGKNISATFHGRDIFAPVAVKLLSKEKLEHFTDQVHHPIIFSDPDQENSANTFKLKILNVDHFGNLILNFRKDHWAGIKNKGTVRLKWQNIFIEGIKNTFSDVETGDILALWDSSGYLQIAQSRGNASKTLGIKTGDQVVLLFLD